MGLSGSRPQRPPMALFDCGGGASWFRCISDSTKTVTIIVDNGTASGDNLDGSVDDVLAKAGVALCRRTVEPADQ